MIIDGVEYVKKEDVSELKYCIVRSKYAGVHAGYIKSQSGMEVVLLKSRRIFYWEGAFTLSTLAEIGTTKPDKCKFPMVVEECILTEVIEIIICSHVARKSIEGVPIWKP